MSNLATFKLNDQHKVVLTTDKVKCDTCSLSDVTAKAVLFMYKNGVIKMIVDGAEIKRT
jgi:hypothetical protein